jgi:hypothetical protein
LTPGREQLRSQVGLNDCAWCSRSHGCDVDILGGSSEAIDQAIVDLGAAPLDEELRELFRFLRKLVQSPGQGESDWKAVLEAGWTPTAVDAVAESALSWRSRSGAGSRREARVWPHRTFRPEERSGCAQSSWPQ